MAALALGLFAAGDPLAEAALAESLGFDSVWLRAQPVATVVAAVAARTSRVRIAGGVDLGGDLDPVRVAEDYATVDAIANGRVELVACAAAADTYVCRARLRENLELLRRLWSEPAVTWSGRFRAPLEAAALEPRPVQRPHPPIWIGGASAAGIELAAALGLPVLLAGGTDFAPLAARYRRGLTAAGHDPALARVGCVHRVRLVPGELRPDPDAICGSPAEVAERIGAARDALGLAVHVSRFDAGGLGSPQVARTIELFAAEVAPRLRRA